MAKVLPETVGEAERGHRPYMEAPVIINFAKRGGVCVKGGMRKKDAYT